MPTFFLGNRRLRSDARHGLERPPGVVSAVRVVPNPTAPGPHRPLAQSHPSSLVRAPPRHPPRPSAWVLPSGGRCDLKGVGGEKRSDQRCRESAPRALSPPHNSFQGCTSPVKGPNSRVCPEIWGFYGTGKSLGVRALSRAARPRPRPCRPSLCGATGHGERTSGAAKLP